MSGGDHNQGEGCWRVERYDHTWGGWRPVAKSFSDDSPAEFGTKRAADEARARMEMRSSFDYRVREVAS